MAPDNNLPVSQIVAAVVYVWPEVWSKLRRVAVQKAMTENVLANVVFASRVG